MKNTSEELHSNDTPGAVESQDSAVFLYTKIISTQKNLSKQFNLLPDGTLKPKPGGNLWKGKVVLCRSSLHSYIKEMMNKEKQELWVAVYGVPVLPGEIFKLTTKDQTKGGLKEGEIVRTKQYLTFKEGEPGFWVFDYDPPKFMPDERDKKPLSAKELIQIFYTALPCLKEQDTQMCVVSSSSSYIYRESDKEMLRGDGGKRIIIPVDNAAMIPAMSEYFEQQLWLHGYGRHKITHAGTTRKTTVLDLCFGKQPERIDFTPAGAICGEGLYQARPDPMFVGSQVLVADLVPKKVSKKDLDKIKELIAVSKSKRSIEAIPVRQAAIAEKVETIIKRSPHFSKAKVQEQVERLYEKRELGCDMLLYLEDEDEPVSVGEIVANPKDYHEKKCLPPLDEDDPDYQRYWGCKPKPPKIPRGIEMFVTC